MKKLLLIAASTALISSAAFADDSFYVSANIGVPHFHSVTDKGTTLKAKTDHTPLASLAVGYGIMDNVKGELEFTYHFGAKLKKSGSVNNVAKTTTHKPRVMSLMVKGIVDIFDAGPAKIFVDAGVGMAQVNEKISNTSAGLAYNYKSKKKNNFAYTLGAGASFAVADGIEAVAAYAWDDYGTTKSFKEVGTNSEVSKTRLRAHVGKIGLRFGM